MKKRLYDISWQVTEAEYRQDPALSYSTLARFNREGFNKLDSLFDRVESPSLTFGSAVDALITGGQEEFDKNFMVAEFPPLSDSVTKMVKVLFERYSTLYNNIEQIPSVDVIAITEELKYQLNWKPETRVKVIKEQGFEYYKLLYVSQGKTILDTLTKEKVDSAVRALRESDATRDYFAPNTPFDDDVVREYQLKFKDTIDGIDYRCMADLLLVNNVDKIIYPIDLKTSSHTEWDFFESFVQWSYAIQSRLYWLIIRHNLDKDDYWKDYQLANYRFIVVNKETLTPLVWEFEDTQVRGTLYYGKNKQIEMKDPLDLGKELSFYLNNIQRVPLGITSTGVNSITQWLKNK